MKKIIIISIGIILFLSCEDICEPACYCNPPCPEPAEYKRPSEYSIPFNFTLNLKGSNIKISEIDEGINKKYLIAGSADDRAILAVVNNVGKKSFELDDGSKGAFTDPTWDVYDFLVIKNKVQLLKYNPSSGLIWELTNDDLSSGLGLSDVEILIEEIVVLNCDEYCVVLRIIGANSGNIGHVNLILNKDGQKIMHRGYEGYDVNYFDAVAWDVGSEKMVIGSVEGAIPGLGMIMDCDLGESLTVPFYHNSKLKAYRDTLCVFTINASGAIIYHRDWHYQHQPAGLIYVSTNESTIQDMIFIGNGQFAATGFTKAFGNGINNYYVEIMDIKGKVLGFTYGNTEYPQKGVQAFKTDNGGFIVFGENGNGSVFISRTDPILE